MLNIVSSNRTEALLALLVARLRTADSAGPFASWQIVVPSIAMRTLLQNQIAAHMGICANVEFSFLAQWLWTQVARLTPVSEESPLAAEAMVWRIHATLEDESFVAAHPRLSSWLEKADPAMRYDLCQRVAALFDKYMTYRTEWMEAWMGGRTVSLGEGGEGGKGEDADEAREDQRWQMALWQRIAAGMNLPGRHPFVEFLELLKRYDQPALEALGMPAEIHVFALPAIPPIYLRMLERLSAHVDIHLYLINPCQEYWFDIVDPKRLSYLAAKGKDQHLEVGNRLLAMWGKQSKTFLELLLQDPAPGTDEALFVPPDEVTLLGQLQAAVFDMREIEPGSAAGMEWDGSIEFHACHTLSRELEVLQDRLLARFNQEDGEDGAGGANAPSPSQVLVVVPDLEQAAPLIDAVFGSATGARRIPYRITGRPASSANPVAGALLELISIAGSRYYASAVFGLLQNSLIGARAGITPSGLDVILGWLPATQTHWGLDAGQRADFNAPPSDRHTFREGLARLYLGYALPPSAEEPFAGLLAPCNVEGDDSRILASFDWFLRKLAAMEERLAQPASPEQWRSILLDIADDFLDVAPEQLGDLAGTRAAIAALTANMSAGGTTTLPFAVVRSALKDALDEPTRGGSPTGSVTFSALPSLRNLPYDTVCMLGMCDGAFPGVNRPAEFDLMRLMQKAGDRDKRVEERNLFLDLMLAARKTLYISYTGRSVRDNTPLPPSVLVSDLLDYLAEATADDPDDRASRAAARAALVLEHPLQPFSEAYFDGQGDPRLFSFHAEYCDALKERRASQEPAASGQATALVADAARAAEAADAAEAAEPGDVAESDDDEQVAQQLPAFFEHSLPAPGDEWRRVSPAQLIEFFKNPCKYLLRRRMRLTLPEDAAGIDDDEAFLPDHLSAIRLAQRLLPHMLAGMQPQQIRELAVAGLEYPAGPLGALLMDSELDSMSGFAQDLQAMMGAPLLPPVSSTIAFTIEGEQWLLEGALADVRADGLLRYRYADATVADYLTAWISHLFLNACQGQPHKTEWLARNGRFGFNPVEDPAALLQQLIALYRRGLSQPLHFFPKSAWESIKKDNPNAARSKWTGGMFAGEGDDAAYQLALRGLPDPLDGEFAELSETVLVTMKRHLDSDPL
ncbi:exodeoxyribonuclease V subunit gamma [Lacisediminimonas profundi]|uniref:exodeoxyribonuclease V subunit gamma n=1 Tax=Lacisediminimonas profundi TaxID=2603856 RepID=UPI00124B9E0D|nr:exodeoxyribonuclease V subunit gamma [Lacisediminimonas profundi]